MANNASAISKARELEHRGVAILVGAPTIFELYVGVSLSNKALEEKSKIVSTAASLPQLHLDYESARAGAEIYVERLKAGFRIDVEDAMIAGIAKTRGETVITRNARHFANIESLRVESY